MSTTSPTPLRVLVADPHFCAREGVRAILGSRTDVQFVGEAEDGFAALALTTTLRPDLVVVEVDMPRLSGSHLVELLSRSSKVLILTACEHVATLQFLLASGAAGLVLKRSPKERIVQAFKAVLAGGTFIDPQVGGWLICPTANEQALAPDEMLEARESQIMHLVAIGYSNKEISKILKISIKMIEVSKRRAKSKLNARSRVDVIRWALSRGWLSASGFPDTNSDL